LLAVGVSRLLLLTFAFSVCSLLHDLGPLVLAQGAFCCGVSFMKVSGVFMELRRPLMPLPRSLVCGYLALGVCLRILGHCRMMAGAG
jgi:hypothetical protein